MNNIQRSIIQRAIKSSPENIDKSKPKVNISTEPKECEHGCQKVIVWRDKDPLNPRDTGYRERDDDPKFDLKFIHTELRCLTLRSILHMYPVRHPIIFHPKYHLCPKCRSKLWVTLKFHARENRFYKQCQDCKYKVVTEFIHSKEDLNSEIAWI